MPVLKKEIELSDGKKIWVRQASGMQKLKIENKQARVFRSVRHFGLDPTEWTEEQQTEFAEKLDDMGAGMVAQIEAWIPDCILEKDFDIDSLNSEELRDIIAFVRGDDEEGAIPLDNSS